MGSHSLLSRRIKKFFFRFSQIRVNQVWGGIFLLWTLILSGYFSSWGSSPGVAQALSLRSILRDKQAELQQIELDIERINAESEQLKNSLYAQEKEVRKTLGYVDRDEIIFDFSSARRPLLRGE